ncbi:MAG: O-antigen ligase family protein [Bacteroidales bacterium]|jgi:O-antigen ligase|nr:O-antigen ligase family protein [Bacteroidales bacterium]
MKAPLWRMESTKNSMILSKSDTKIYVFGSIFIAICLICQIFPPLFVLDSTTMKHYIFALANLSAIVFILYYIISLKEKIPSYIFKNSISYLWLLLLLIMLLSFFQAMNIPESIVTINRWVIIYLMFLYITLFLVKKPSLFNLILTLTLIISIINILWCIIAYYYVGANYNPRKNLYINGFYGNKNIFAVAILFKLPFLYYISIFRRGIKRYLSWFLIFGLTFCLVILSARASFIGLIFQLILLSCFIILFFKGKKRILFSFIVVIFAIFGFISGDWFIKYNFNRYGKKSEATKIYHLKEDSYALSTRFKSIEERNSKGRLKIWRNTISIIKDKPLLGYGIGNHKLAIMRVETPQKANYIVSDHAHNDFLEIFSELGIFGLLVYISLFAASLIMVIKTLRRKNISLHNKFISFIGLLLVITYMNDAMFNFPADRADCQLYLALAFSLIVLIYYKNNSKETRASTKKVVFFVIAFLTIPITTIESMHYMSSILQKAKILQTNGSKRITLTAQEWDKLFPPIPNIDENANPIALTKGMRYDAEKNWRKAIDVIINDNSNPYLSLKEYRLSNYYNKLNMYDSALYWANRTIKLKPLCYEPVRTIYRVLIAKNNFIEADKQITSFINKYPFEENAYLDLANVKEKLYNPDSAIKVLISAKTHIPLSKKIDEKLKNLQGKASKN